MIFSSMLLRSVAQFRKIDIALGYHTLSLPVDDAEETVSSITETITKLLFEL